MKRLFLYFLLFIGFYSYSQNSTLVINNYSNFYLKGRLGANGNSNCFPMVFAVPSAGAAAYTVPPVTTTVYKKLYNSDLSAVPITSWLVKTSATNPSVIRAYNHPVISTISPYTEWSMFWFQTYDANNVAYEEFKMGIQPCNTSSTTYQLGSYSESEWFTITSGTNDFTYLNIY